MNVEERQQVFANGLKLFTEESTDAVKALAGLGALPDKLAFGPEGYIIFSDPNDASAYTQFASMPGKPLYWEVTSQPYNQDLTPVQQRALRRYGFTVPQDSGQNPHQEWPRARVDELPNWLDRIFRDVFGLPAEYDVALDGGI
jgi:hypothetical protein